MTICTHLCAQTQARAVCTDTGQGRVQTSLAEHTEGHQKNVLGAPFLSSTASCCRGSEADTRFTG